MEAEGLDWFMKLLGQAPGMAALVLMVWFFLQHLRHRDEALEKRDKSFCDTLREIESGCAAAQAAAANRMEALFHRLMDRAEK